MLLKIFYNKKIKISILILIFLFFCYRIFLATSKWKNLDKEQQKKIRKEDAHGRYKFKNNGSEQIIFE